LTHRTARTLVAALAVGLAAPALLGPAPAQAAPDAAAAAAPGRPGKAGKIKAIKQPPRAATRVGKGGAVTSVDPYATAIGLKVLRRGGNAVDAAIATAAALGVTEPYSSGIGGGGYLVYHDAKSGRTTTIDGRETAPAGVRPDSFVDPATGKPYPFTPDLVTSGVSVGVPGTPATWDQALRRWGTTSLAEALAPATVLARRGFVIDSTFRQQTADNEERFRTFSSTRKLYLKGGLPGVGRRFANPDLADTYDLLAQRGVQAFYRGPLAREISSAVRKPPTTGRTDLPVPPGTLRAKDLRRYRTAVRPAVSSTYRGLEVRGMPPSSSGGTTVGEALNILEQFPLATMAPVQALHHYLEASALAFADRAKYVGDPASVAVPETALLSDAYGAERACLVDPARAATKPVAAGDVSSFDGQCAPGTPGAGRTAEDTENISTTNLTVVDRRGNVVEYTLTIEQTGGSGIVVPGRGFLLNNELTDFTTVYSATDPNRIAPGKRPRSSMAPTIVLRGGKPFLAVGSPGGSTIITTVLQFLVNRIDLGMTLPQAIAAPRASQRNTATVSAEPAFVAAYGPGLTALGHTLGPAGDSFGSLPEIGAATGIEIGPDGQLTAVAEPTRRGGGAAGVVRRQK
jgi:gamma-glutamyltranspeptidase/glutathione hydrolase